MNDRHLFRGKHTDGRWKTWLAINGAVQAWEILSDTIGQCTGLKDRNGKLIFEGDIILKVTEAVDVSVPYYVYQNHCGQYILHRSKDYISALDARLSDGDDYEIIGNIHDNPELLATEIESDLPAAGGGIKMEMRSCKNCEHKALEAKTKH
ncbi:MAG: YopX family protein, partial [Firmicutes bacterium]|nr:YopX family protein [Bacillota bacterium]